MLRAAVLVGRACEGQFHDRTPLPPQKALLLECLMKVSLGEPGPVGPGMTQDPTTPTFGLVKGADSGVALGKVSGQDSGVGLGISLDIRLKQVQAQARAQV